MRWPIQDDEVILKFTSIRQHELYCQDTGAGSRFIYRRSGNNIHVLARVHAHYPKDTYPKVRLTPLEQSLLEMR